MLNQIGYDYDGDEFLPQGSTTPDQDDARALEAKRYLDSPEAWGEVMQEARS